MSSCEREISRDRSQLERDTVFGFGTLTAHPARERRQATDRKDAMFEQKTLGIIGAGNMGGALVRGVVRSGVVSPDRLIVGDPSAEVRAALARECGVAVDADSATVVERADVVLLAVKPFLLRDVVAGVRDRARDDQLVLSVVAGVRGETIQEAFGRKLAVVRAMPNLPATVGAGATAIAAVAPAGPAELDLAESIFGAVGAVARVSEHQLDAVTGLSGSGPAYVYTVIEALADGGVLVGLPRDVARELAVQTVLGAAEVVKKSGEHPAVLRDRVTTPGGTTIAGLKALEDHGLRAALQSAVVAATERSRELG